MSSKQHKTDDAEGVMSPSIPGVEMTTVRIHMDPEICLSNEKDQMLGDGSVQTIDQLPLASDQLRHYEKDLLNLDGVHLLSRHGLALRFATALEARSGTQTLPQATAPSVTREKGLGSDAPAASATDDAAAVTAVTADTADTADTAAGSSEIVSSAPAAPPTGGSLDEYLANPVLSDNTTRRLTERHQSRLHTGIENLDPELTAGLSEAEHETRLAEMGPNVVKPLEKQPLWLRYLSLYAHPFMLLLLFAIVVSFIMYGLYPDQRENLIVGIALTVVVIFSCTSEFYQEIKSKSTMSSFAALVPRQAMVVRGGCRLVVPAASLVVGDLVVLRTGDQAAADIRLFKTNGLKVDNSAVTGEAEPVVCSPFFDGADASQMSPAVFDQHETHIEDAYFIAVNALTSMEKTTIQDVPNAVSSERKASSSESSRDLEAGTNPSAVSKYEPSPAELVALKAYNMPLNETKNIVFAGCSVVEGDGLGIVIATAERSMVGQIMSLTMAVTQKESSLQLEILRLIKFLGIAAALQTLMVLIVCLGRGDDLSTIFTQAMVVIIIANVPQGLPTAVMTCLTIVASRMIDKKVYVKQVANIETLGCATVIASDKTGTLTQNKMTVTRIWADHSTVTPAIVHDQAHPSAVFTRFDPLAYVNAHAHRNVSITRMPSPTPSFSTGANSVDGSTGLDDLVSRVSAVPGDECSRLQNSFAILDIICAICNQTKYEDESASTEPPGLHGEEKTESMALPARIHSYLVKDWYGREQARVRITEGQRERKAIGDPSDLAVFNYVAERQSIELMRYKLPVVFHLPFNSTNKFMLTAAQYVGPAVPQDRMLVLMKGAPEIVLEKCNYYQHQGRRYDKTDAFVRHFTQQYMQFAADGERVIACAYLEMAEYGMEPGAVKDRVYTETINAEGWVVPGESREVPLPVAPTRWNEKVIPTTGFTFVGLLSLSDPPKETVPKAVKAVREAGVKVIMVTGDHPLTAKAIARQVGIITLPTQDEVDAALLAPHYQPIAHENVAQSSNSNPLIRAHELPEDDNPPPANVVVDPVANPQQVALVATGAEIRNWNDDEWIRNLSRPEIVFARTTPQQKLQIVEYLQRLNHIVCVTGDGVNDSPALKQANIGIAMGISGSDVARDAADIILLDDDFSSIVAGIMEGRLLFANLTKILAYTLTHLWPEVGPALTSIIFRIPLGLSSMAVLAIDCGTELAPSVSLAYQPMEDELMKQPPRDIQRDRLLTGRLLAYSLVTQGILMLLVCFASYGLVASLHGIPISFLLNSTGTYWTEDAPPLSTSDGHVYSGADQILIRRQMQTAYFMTLVMSQVGHIFLCKTRTTSFFNVGFLDNIPLLKGVTIEMVIMFALLFIPTVNSEGFGFKEFPDSVWAIPFIGWGIYLLYSEICKWFRRNRPNSPLGKILGF